MKYERDVYVYNEATNSYGIIRDVNHAPDPPLCRVFYGSVYGHAIVDWTSARELTIVTDRARIPLSIRRKHGKGSTPLRMDATGKTHAQIVKAVKFARHKLRSTYVYNLQNGHKTRHTYAVGKACHFYGVGVASGTSEPRPCTIKSHDRCYTWSGYVDSWYTVQFADGGTRSWISTSHLRPPWFPLA